MKKYLPHLLFVALVATYAYASSIKVWSSGEVLRSADLNSNFSHIHTTKVGDGVLLVNSDVSGTAAISHSKLATPSLIPKAKATVEQAAAPGSSCSATPCGLVEAVGITSVTWSATGTYLVNLTTAGANSNFNVQLSLARDSDGNCAYASSGTTAFAVTCYNSAGASADKRFSIVVWDN